MAITVGRDEAKTRRILKSGNLSVAYYSIAAAEKAGLGDFEDLPAVLKVVLENISGKNISVVPTSPPIAKFIKRNRRYKKMLPVGIRN